MSRIISIIIGSLIILVSFYIGFKGNEKTIDHIKAEKEGLEESNHLSSETDDYLLKHKDDSLNWYAWSVQTKQVALDHKKMMLVFLVDPADVQSEQRLLNIQADEQLKKLMNEHFILVLLDVKQAESEAPELLKTSQAFNKGDLSMPQLVFLTPDSKPFYSEKFNNNNDLNDSILKVIGLWESNAQQILDSAENVKEYFTH